jgi:hypothetical protein
MIQCGYRTEAEAATTPDCCTTPYHILLVLCLQVPCDGSMIQCGYRTEAEADGTPASSNRTTIMSYPYARLGGRVVLRGSDMPMQQEAWDMLSTYTQVILGAGQLSLELVGLQNTSGAGATLFESETAAAGPLVLYSIVAQSTVLRGRKSSSWAPDAAACSWLAAMALSCVARDRQQGLAVLTAIASQARKNTVTPKSPNKSLFVLCCAVLCCTGRLL